MRHFALILIFLSFISCATVKVYSDFDENTKKHMREMDALVNHNRFLSQYNKKILYSNGFAARLNTKGTKNDLYC